MSNQRQPPRPLGTMTPTPSSSSFDDNNNNDDSSCSSKSSGSGGEREDFLCPITMCEMEDPVVASDGNTYERKAILAYINGAEMRGVPPTSPLTREVLTPSVLIPNRALKTTIDNYHARKRQEREVKDSKRQQKKQQQRKQHSPQTPSTPQQQHKRQQESTSTTTAASSKTIPPPSGKSATVLPIATSSASSAAPTPTKTAAAGGTTPMKILKKNSSSAPTTTTTTTTKTTAPAAPAAVIIPQQAPFSTADTRMIPVCENDSASSYPVWYFENTRALRQYLQSTASTSQNPGHQLVMKQLTAGGTAAVSGMEWCDFGGSGSFGGTCLFGEECRFLHPRRIAVWLSPAACMAAAAVAASAASNSNNNDNNIAASRHILTALEQHQMKSNSNSSRTSLVFAGWWPLYHLEKNKGLEYYIKWINDPNRSHHHSNHHHHHHHSHHHHYPDPETTGGLGQWCEEGLLCAGAGGSGTTTHNIKKCKKLHHRCPFVTIRHNNYLNNYNDNVPTKFNKSSGKLPDVVLETLPTPLLICNRGLSLLLRTGNRHNSGMIISTTSTPSPSGQVKGKTASAATTKNDDAEELNQRLVGDLCSCTHDDEEYDFYNNKNSKNYDSNYNSKDSGGGGGGGGNNEAVNVLECKYIHRLTDITRTMTVAVISSAAAPAAAAAATTTTAVAATTKVAAKKKIQNNHHFEAEVDDDDWDEEEDEDDDDYDDDDYDDDDDESYSSEEDHHAITTTTTTALTTTNNTKSSKEKALAPIPVSILHLSSTVLSSLFLRGHILKKILSHYNKASASSSSSHRHHQLTERIPCVFGNRCTGLVAPSATNKNRKSNSSSKKDTATATVVADKCEFLHPRTIIVEGGDVPLFLLAENVGLALYKKAFPAFFVDDSCEDKKANGGAAYGAFAECVNGPHMTSFGTRNICSFDDIRGNTNYQDVESALIQSHNSQYFPTSTAATVRNTHSSANHQPAQQQILPLALLQDSPANTGFYQWCYARRDDGYYRHADRFPGIPPHDESQCPRLHLRLPDQHATVRMRTNDHEEKDGGTDIPISLLEVTAGLLYLLQNAPSAAEREVLKLQQQQNDDKKKKKKAERALHLTGLQCFRQHDSPQDLAACTKLHFKQQVLVDDEHDPVPVYLFQPSYGLKLYHMRPYFYRGLCRHGHRCVREQTVNQCKFLHPKYVQVYGEDLPAYHLLPNSARDRLLYEGGGSLPSAKKGSAAPVASTPEGSQWCPALLWAQAAGAGGTGDHNSNGTATSHHHHHRFQLSGHSPYFGIDPSSCCGGSAAAAVTTAASYHNVQQCPYLHHRIAHIRVHVSLGRTSCFSGRTTVHTGDVFPLCRFGMTKGLRDVLLNATPPTPVTAEHARRRHFNTSSSSSKHHHQQSTKYSYEKCDNTECYPPVGVICNRHGNHDAHKHEHTECEYLHLLPLADMPPPPPPPPTLSGTQKTSTPTTTVPAAAVAAATSTPTPPVITTAPTTTTTPAAATTVLPLPRSSQQIQQQPLPPPPPPPPPPPQNPAAAVAAAVSGNSGITYQQQQQQQPPPPPPAYSHNDWQPQPPQLPAYRDPYATTAPATATIATTPIGRGGGVVASSAGAHPLAGHDEDFEHVYTQPLNDEDSGNEQPPQQQQDDDYEDEEDPEMAAAIAASLAESRRLEQQQQLQQQQQQAAAAVATVPVAPTTNSSSSNTADGRSVVVIVPDAAALIKLTAFGAASKDLLKVLVRRAIKAKAAPSPSANNNGSSSSRFLQPHGGGAVDVDALFAQPQEDVAVRLVLPAVALEALEQLKRTNNARNAGDDDEDEKAIHAANALALIQTALSLTEQQQQQDAPAALPIRVQRPGEVPAARELQFRSSMTAPLSDNDRIVALVDHLHRQAHAQNRQHLQSLQKQSAKNNNNKNNKNKNSSSTSPPPAEPVSVVCFVTDDVLLQYQALGSIDGLVDDPIGRTILETNQLVQRLRLDGR